MTLRMSFCFRNSRYSRRCVRRVPIEQNVYHDVVEAFQIRRIEPNFVQRFTLQTIRVIGWRELLDVAIRRAPRQFRHREVVFGIDALEGVQRIDGMTVADDQRVDAAFQYVVAIRPPTFALAQLFSDLKPELLSPGDGEGRNAAGCRPRSPAPATCRRHRSTEDGNQGREKHTPQHERPIRHLCLPVRSFDPTEHHCRDQERREDENALFERLKFATAGIAFEEADDRPMHQIQRIADQSDRHRQPVAQQTSESTRFASVDTQHRAKRRHQRVQTRERCLVAE